MSKMRKQIKLRCDGCHSIIKKGGINEKEYIGSYYSFCGSEYVDC